MRNAWNGLRHIVITEHSSVPHILVAFGVLATSVALKLPLEEWRWILLALALVWVTEAVNTAVERLADAVSMERNERVRQAKDTAAWAVMLAILASALIILTVFVPRILWFFEIH